MGYIKQVETSKTARGESAEWKGRKSPKSWKTNGLGGAVIRGGPGSMVTWKGRGKRGRFFKKGGGGAKNSGSDAIIQILWE